MLTYVDHSLGMVVQSPIIGRRAKIRSFKVNGSTGELVISDSQELPITRIDDYRYGGQFDRLAYQTNPQTNVIDNSVQHHSATGVLVGTLRTSVISKNNTLIGNYAITPVGFRYASIMHKS